MDKLTAIKIKYDDGTYSDEIPVSVLSENVEWDSTHTLVDVLGSIDVDVTGTIQDQISQLFNEKVSASALQSYVASQLNTDVVTWLQNNVNPVGSAVVVDKSLTIEGAAADAKVVGNKLNDFNTPFVNIPEIYKTMVLPIKAIFIYNNNEFSNFAIQYFWHNYNNYDCYIRLVAYNGEDWVTFDSYSRNTMPNNRDTIEYITGMNGLFSMIIDWSDALEQINLSVNVLINKMCIVDYQQKINTINEEINTLTSNVDSIDAANSKIQKEIGNYLYSVKPAAGYKYVHIPIADTINAGTTIYAQALSNSSNVEEVLLIGQYSGQRDLIDLSDGQSHIYTTILNYTNVEIVYKLLSPTDGTTDYSAVCIKSDDPVSLSKDLLDSKQETQKFINVIDSPFSVQIDSKFKGIIGFEFLITPLSDSAFSAINNQKYRITNIYYKDAFYLYLSMERLVNGEWVSYDNITISLANAPTENALMFVESNYNRFRMAYLPGLMQAGRAANIEYIIKNTAINPFITKLQDDFDEYVRYDSYEIKPTIRTRVTVKKDGTGDYTTIGAAYAAISKKSSFFNQYEVCVYPGVYEEVNLICPAYSHTHGMFPNTVTVTSEGKTGTNPVFDQTGRPSRLSNMKIISATGYCIHVDSPLIHSIVNEGLYCKKVYSSDVSDFAWENSNQHRVIIGMGAQPAGMMIVFDGCTFEDGAVVCHTNSSSEENSNFTLVINNCKVINAKIQLNKAGNAGAALYGNWMCKINNLAMIKGQAKPGIALFYGEPVTGLDYNFGWQIIGGNINTAIEFKKDNDPTAPDCWDNIQLTEKSYIQANGTITKNQWITDDMIPANANEYNKNIIGIALDNATEGDTVPIWTGKAFFVNITDGEYGIGADGTLSSSANIKIGKVKNGILYRYSN